jgi:hypothetical protein
MSAPGLGPGAGATNVRTADVFHHFPGDRRRCRRPRSAGTSGHGPERGDFELFEDGVRQKIVTVSLTMPGIPDAAAAAVPSTGPRAPAREGLASPKVPIAHETGAVALVFDRLAPESRGMAYKAAQTSVDQLSPDDLMGVFLIDRSLETIQRYTSDRQQLHAAIEGAARPLHAGLRRR